MRTIGLIVEGHGEVRAAPILVRRIAAWLDPDLDLKVLDPHRMRKGRLLKPDDLKRTVEFVARRAGPSSPILILLDADDDCPATWGPQLLGWARQQRSDRQHSVVLAKSAYEAWFIASVAAISQHPEFSEDPPLEHDPEGIRYPKSWLGQRLRHGYSPTVDQLVLTRLLDVEQACRAPSFRKLVRDLARLLELSVPMIAKEPSS